MVDKLGADLKLSMIQPLCVVLIERVTIICQKDMTLT